MAKRADEPAAYPDEPFEACVDRSFKGSEQLVSDRLRANQINQAFATIEGAVER